MSKKRKQPSIAFWTLIVMFLLNGLFLLLKKEGYDINLMYQSNPEEVLQKINKKYHPLILKHFAKVDENMEQERKLQEQVQITFI